jgi:hypothetical protein
MKENHEKTGLAAFILALLGLLTLGLTALPALACALISKRQAQAIGKPTDGYATSAVIVSLFLLGLAFLVFMGGGAAALVNSDWGKGFISVDSIEALMYGTGLLVIVCLILVLARTRSQHDDERTRLRKLAGRGGGGSTGVPGQRWHRRRATAEPRPRHWD